MSYGYHYPPRQRYSRWDGTQQISDFTADDIMYAISDDMLNDGDLQRALQRLFRWGMDRPDGQQMPGIRNLIERLKGMRQQELNRYDLGSVLEDLKQRLEEIQQMERDGIQRRVDEGRQKVAEARQQQAGQQGESGQTGEAGQSGESGDGEAPDPDQSQMLQDMLERMAARKNQALNELPEDPAGQIKELPGI